MSTAARSERVEAYVTPEQKAQLEAISKRLECSQSASVGMLIEDAYQRAYNDLDPRAISENRVADATLDQLEAGKLAIDEIDPELRLNPDENDSAEPTGADAETDPAETEVSLREKLAMIASDGGATVNAPSYSPIPTRADLTKQGRVLDWETIRKVTSDERFDDKAKIHPGRIDRENLRSRRKPISRVLAGICRHQFGTVISGQEIDELIDHYVGYKTDRINEDEARAYFRETYRETMLNAELLYPHPNPDKDAYYMTEEAYRDAIATYVTDTTDELGGFVNTMAREKWFKAHNSKPGDSEALRTWKNDVAEALSDLAVLETIRTEHTETVLALDGDDAGGFDYDIDEHPSITVYLKRFATEYLGFVDALIEGRYYQEILDHHVSDRVRKIISDID
ncbi:hypothetical protein [Halegenticoccus tardaugens]|uniref:hypothetical protein n=1 Tax=Halegenticoccus tardaugens TaxID=2071624 RepID=UPI00100BFD58|nr:hypothetical protein [Halegenticoccus tardaugens]